MTTMTLTDSLLHRCLGVARGHLAAGRPEAAVEAIAAGAIADIQQQQQAFLPDARASAAVGEMYAQAFEGAGIVPSAARERVDRAGVTRPWRLVYVLAGVVEGQAASANVERFLRLHDRVKFEPLVLVTEEHTRREPAGEFLKLPSVPSREAGPVTLGRMKSLAPVTVLGTRGTFVDGVREGVGAARAMQADIAVFVGSPACPVQAGMAFARVAPVQVNLNVGVPMVVPGVDAVVYNNPSRQVHDAEFLRSRGVKVGGVETSGADVSRGSERTIAERESMGIPAGAPVLCSASNRLPERMLAGGFAEDLGRFLAEHPRAWWVGIGPGRYAGVKEAVARAGGAGVLERVVLVGPQEDIRPVVRACNVFLNEYPEGGGNTVLEAMGCGIPVVAMKAGARHAESIGAILAGEHAVWGADRGAYWAKAAEWLGNPLRASLVGEVQRRRALARYDYPVIARAYERVYEGLLGAA